MGYQDNYRPDIVEEALKTIRALRKVALTREMLFYAEQRATLRLSAAEVTAVATSLAEETAAKQAARAARTLRIQAPQATKQTEPEAGQ